VKTKKKPAKTKKSKKKSARAAVVDRGIQISRDTNKDWTLVDIAKDLLDNDEVPEEIFTDPQLKLKVVVTILGDGFRKKLINIGTKNDPRWVRRMASYKVEHQTARGEVRLHCWREIDALERDERVESMRERCRNSVAGMEEDKDVFDYHNKLLIAQGELPLTLPEVEAYW
jgi:hypothetical protein